MRIFARSSGGYKSVLLNTNSDRLPISASPIKGAYSEARRSLSTTNNNRSAAVASSRAIASRWVPAVPASKMPGVSVSNICRSKPFNSSVYVSPLVVVPIAAPTSPTIRPIIALISEVLPAEPVPKTTTLICPRARFSAISRDLSIRA